MQQIEVNAAFEYHSFLGQLIQFPEVQSVPDPVYLAYLAITVSGYASLNLKSLNECITCGCVSNQSGDCAWI
eukprot:403359962